MTDMQRHEKDEKEDEKRNEKSWEEKRRRDPLVAVGWAIIFIWAGFIFLIENLNLLDDITFLRDFDTWDMILGGAGLIVLALAAVRVLVPEYRGPVIGNIILGLFLVGVAVGDVIGWGAIWAVLLIAAGVAMLLGGFLRRP
jgi:vacuolar-type H+-ATPase subunit I/STV1